MLKKQFSIFMFTALIALTCVLTANAQSSTAKSMAEEIKKEYPYREGQVAENATTRKSLLKLILLHLAITPRHF